jgi:hypothetical protein
LFEWFVKPAASQILKYSLLFHSICLNLYSFFLLLSFCFLLPSSVPVVARLDDSNDEVRVAICGALIMFFQCAAHPRCFSGTTIDYTLDQLFVHLDDPDPAIQTAVLQAIVQAARSLDKEAVLAKAEKNRAYHRSPAMCDKVVVEVTGLEILQD